MSFLGRLAKGALGAVTGFATGGPVGAAIGGVSGALKGGGAPKAQAPAGGGQVGRPATPGGTPTFSGAPVQTSSFRGSRGTMKKALSSGRAFSSGGR